MIRGLTKNQIIVMFVMSLVVAAGFNIASRSFAATAPKVTMLGYSAGVPKNGGVVTASKSSNKFKATFKVRASDSDSLNGLTTQVVYKRAGENVWHNFGTNPIKGPDGNNTAPNNMKNSYTFPDGRNCAMSWSDWPIKPKNCVTIARNTSGRSGLPAWSGYPTYSASVDLAPGTYYWRARSHDGSLYSSWASQWSFTVKSYPLPTSTNSGSDGSTAEYYATELNKESTNDAQRPEVAGRVVEAASNKNKAPTQPKNLKAAYNKIDSSVELRWSASTDDGTLAGYELERREAGKNYWENIKNIYDPAYKDFATKPNASYEYRVRARDGEGLFSDYSNISTVKTDAIEPNILKNQEGEVKSEDGNVILRFSQFAASEDMIVAIEKTDPRDIEAMLLEQKTKLLGSVYSIIAKNREGKEIKSFKTQVTISFNAGLAGGSRKVAKIATIGEDEDLSYLISTYNSKNASIDTLTSHFSVYFLTAPATNPLSVFLKVLVWLAIIAGLAYGAWLLWQKYQLDKYREEHREDYIYKH